jgi:hypothetical protein
VGFSATGGVACEFVRFLGAAGGAASLRGGTSTGRSDPVSGLGILTC